MHSCEFTGIVVCYNDGRYLGECLDRLKFCRERIVVDLGSTDGSQAIALEHGARVVEHPWVPVVEMVRAFAAEQASTNWIVFMDPDLLFPAGVIDKVQQLIREQPDAAIVTLPYQNYFQGRPLRHGRWGGINQGYPAIIQRERATFSSDVHAGIHAKPGFKTIAADLEPRGVIVHYWIDDWEQLYAKCDRYLQREGEARFRRGQRTSFARCVWTATATMLRSFVWQRGLLDGIVGLRLSLVAGWYEWKANTSLLRIQRKAARDSKVVAQSTVV